ncbi:P27 family phage terminase small subunit [uncultured Gilvimarinus sp.]|uniref:P27 family phage terminase small subunit n=1 Tax=uncultured Gilvimarinus sp. TaxID=1689143 RepID=UPI0030DAF000
MAGRYKGESNIATHPAFDQGAAASAENDEYHAGRAKDLMPKKMATAERAVWRRIAPELSKLGRLKPHFVDFVQEYCIVKVRMDETRCSLDKNDWTYVTVGRHGAQHKSRPEVAQLNDDWRKWNSLVAQLGLSPATELRFNDKQGSLFDDGFGDV